MVLFFHMTDWPLRKEDWCMVRVEGAAKKEAKGSDNRGPSHLCSRSVTHLSPPQLQFLAFPSHHLPQS